MIAAYMDESATHGDDAVLSVAITAATEKRWSQFERDWSPKIATLEKGYHAKRCGFLHNDLADLMVEHTLFSSFVTFRETEFHQHFPKWVQSVIGGPYALGVMFSLASYAMWANIPGNYAGPAFFYIEQGHRGFPQVATMMKVIMATDELRQMFAMAGWDAATKRDVPVACPDTISHLSTEHYGTGSHGAVLDQLFDAGVCLRGNIPEAQFQANIDAFREAARVALRHMKLERDARRAERRRAKKSSV
jgi:hypothetical protein